MDYALIWFLLIAVLWTGYLVLEGFDFGVGMLLPILGRGTDRAGSTGRSDFEERRRLLLATIGPVWDGNEVWVITAIGATFAAFPHWYATMLSAFYLPLLLVLFALIIRVLGLDYRAKHDDPTWRARWDAVIVVGSLLPAFLWGLVFVNMVRGLPIDADMEFTGTLGTLLDPVALLGGLATTAVFVTHGALFVALKSDGQIRYDARRVAGRSGLLALALLAATLTLLGAMGSVASSTTSVVAVAALAVALLANARARERVAFAATATSIAATVATWFVMLHPAVMPSTLDPAWSLTIENAASTAYTLKVMTVVALVFLPFVLLYQGFTYWVFRKRLHVDDLPAEH